MTDTRLKSLADRIDRLEEEKKALTGDVRDIYTEASSAGYNAKALRKVLAERRKKTDEELAADIELYRAALGVSSYRAVSEALGVSKSKLQRLVPKNARGTVPHDPETGEITENAAPKVSHTLPTAEDTPRCRASVQSAPDGGVGCWPHSDEAPLKHEMGHPPSEADAGPIPTFLIRDRVTA